MKIDGSLLPDKELVLLLREDSEVAFRAIYGQYWERLYLLARKRLDDAMEAEEVVQDIFCNLWRRRQKLDLSRGFDNYFAVAVKYEVINKLARRARASEYIKEAARMLSGVDERTMHQLDYNELMRRLHLIIDSLPEKYRVAFTLQQEKGYTQKEIAREMNISEKTVEAYLARVRKILRNSFGSLLGLVIL